MMDDIYNYRDCKLLIEFFKQRLHLNMFVVCDECNNLILKPIIKSQSDINDSQDLAFYNILSKRILFADFYIIGDEVRDMILLKNDALGIMIILIYTEDKSKLEFVGAKTIGGLVDKYPMLLEAKVS